MMLHHFDLSVAHVFDAYYECRQSKRNSLAALAFERDLEANLIALYRELRRGDWTPSPATVFAISHPRPREVWAANFRDRIVHHLIYRAIGPMFERSFIHDSCACIKGRGALHGANRLAGHLRSATQNWTRPAYVLKADVSNFFGSIRRDVLFKRLERKVQNEFLLDLLEKLVFQDVKQGAIVNSTQRELAIVPAHKSLFNAAPGVGLAIGNLSSQFFANVYLDTLDQLVKRQLGMRHYVRYVDDMVVVHESPQVLAAAGGEMRACLAEIGLRFAEHKTSIIPAEKGVDFVGHVIRPFRRSGRAKTHRNALAKLAEVPQESLSQSVNSYLGLSRHTGSRAQTIELCRAAMRRGLSVDYNLTRSLKHAD